MVDTISGLASIDFRFDEKGRVVDSSARGRLGVGQREGLMLPPGLGFNAAARGDEIAETGGTAPVLLRTWNDMKP